MRKIPTLFVRDPSNMARVTTRVEPGCEWVLEGLGTATVKRDGTNVRVTVDDGRLRLVEKRHNPTREEKVAGLEPGYVVAGPTDPADQHIFAAVRATDFSRWPDGLWPCEAVGPKIQGGAGGTTPALYAFSLWPELLMDGNPRSFGEIRAYLERVPIEGIVWHDGFLRMAKIKRRDFGFPWPPRT